MEPVTLDSRYGSVTVTAETTEWADGTLWVLRYVITTPTGYRAVLSACQRDECRLTAELKTCARLVGDNGRHSGMKLGEWEVHIRTHCHGIHAESAVEFAKKVLATYGPQKAFSPSVSRIGVPASEMPYMRRIEQKQTAQR